MRFHAVAVGVVSGLIVGVPLGLLNRLFQRVSAIMGGEHLDFTVAGTGAIVFFTVMTFSIPAGIAYVLIRDRLPVERAAHIATYAASLFLLLGLPFLWAAPMGLNTTGNVWMNRLMYGSLVVLGGVALPPVVSWIRPRFVRESGWMGTAIDGVLVLLGIAGGAFMLLMGFVLLNE